MMDGWTVGWTVGWVDGGSEGRYLLGQQGLAGVQASGPPLLLQVHVDAHVSLGVSGQTAARNT